jgi:glucosamine-6-phosphate isomerase
MKISIYENYNALSKSAADYIVDYINNKPQSVLSFPSGNSATGTIEYLVHYAKEGKVDFSQCYFVGLDEWIGFGENKEGGCKHYIYSKMLTPLQINDEKVIHFDGLASDLDKECERIDQFIATRGPIDLMIVGIGINGHIGLNEPGVSFDLYSHYTPLDTITKKVAQKYFREKTELTDGITLGLRHLMEAKVAILLANGEKKAEIVATALKGPVTNNVPASIIQNHPDSLVFLDDQAASLLSSK